MRIKIIRVIIIGLFLVIAFDLFYVQVIRGQYYYHLSTNNRIRIVPLEGWRGRIIDRNGELLADSRTAYDVMVAPQDIHDRKALFAFLGRTLDVGTKILERRYAQKKLAPFAPVVIAEDIQRDKAIVLEENRYRFPSLIIQEGFKRNYPKGQNSAHVLGHVGRINRARQIKFKEYGYTAQSVIGYSGVEEYYDAYLKGGEGGLQIEVNSRGQQVRLLSLKEPTQGQDISLTIDAKVEAIAMEALEGATGAIIVMDMDNGEILAMVSSPAYDPNVFVDSQKQRLLRSLFTDMSAPFLNRAIQGLYPPGSVFKVPVAIGALDTAKATQYTTFDCRGFLELGGRKFRCVHAHGVQNLIESLAHSCNVYYYKLGSIMGVDGMYEYAMMFGLDRLTAIDLPYEEKGHVPNRRKRFQRNKRPWYGGDTLNLSVGQGDVLVTPLQLVRMMATVGNNGIEVQPHVIKSIGGQPVEQYDFTRQVKVGRSALETVKKGLRAAVANYSGTAHALDIEQLYVAGKTGTAQTSGEQEDHAWFVGYVKDAQRNIAFCVFLEHGGSSHNATLVSRQMLLRMKESGFL